MPVKYAENSEESHGKESKKSVWPGKPWGPDTKDKVNYSFSDKKLFEYLITRLHPDEEKAFREMGRKIEKEGMLTKKEIEKIFKRHVGNSLAVENKLNKVLRSLVEDDALKQNSLKKEQIAPQEFWRRVIQAPSHEKQIEMLQEAGLIKKVETKNPKNVIDFIEMLTEIGESPSREELLGFAKSSGMTPREFKRAVETAVADMKESNAVIPSRIENWKKKLNEPQYFEPANQATLNRFIRDDREIIEENKKKIKKAEELLKILGVTG